MKCISAECKKEATNGKIYCSDCWSKIKQRAKRDDEKNEDQNVPEENIGDFPW